MDYIFNKSVAPLFEAFAAGFHKVCGGKVLLLFQPSELQAMVIGNTNYDWKELEKVWRPCTEQGHQIGFQGVSWAVVTGTTR